MGRADRLNVMAGSRRPTCIKSTSQPFAIGSVGNFSGAVLNAHSTEACTATLRGGGAGGTILSVIAAPAGLSVPVPGFWFTDGLHVTLSSDLGQFFMAAFDNARDFLLIQDFFNGPALQSIENHEPDKDVVGGGWSDEFGTTILDGLSSAIPGDLSGGNTRASIDSGASDVRLECVLSNGGQESGLIIRWVNLDNNWILRCRDGANDLQLVERTAGVNTTRVDVAVNVDPDVPYKMVVYARADVISGFFHRAGQPDVDFIPFTFTSSSHQTATRHGIRDTNAGSLSHYFEVREAE